MDTTTVNHMHHEYMFPCVSNYYSTPLAIKKGEGLYVYDWEGNKYLDFFGGILTVSIGHCQPEITKEMADQIHTLQHSSAGAKLVDTGEGFRSMVRYMPGWSARLPHED